MDVEQNIHTTYVCIHTYIHTYIPIYIYIHTHIYIHIYIYNTHTCNSGLLYTPVLALSLACLIGCAAQGLATCTPTLLLRLAASLISLLPFALCVCPPLSPTKNADLPAA